MLRLRHNSQRIAIFAAFDGKMGVSLPKLAVAPFNSSSSLRLLFLDRTVNPDSHTHFLSSPPLCLRHIFLFFSKKFGVSLV